MLRGKESPQVIIGSINYSFPSDRVITTINYQPNFNDSVSINGTLNRYFIRKRNGKLKFSVTYQIEMIDVTKDESIFFDSIKPEKRTQQQIKFKPHADFNLEYDAFMEFNSFYRNNRYYRDWYIFRITLTEKDHRDIW